MQLREALNMVYFVVGYELLYLLLVSCLTPLGNNINMSTVNKALCLYCQFVVEVTFVFVHISGYSYLICSFWLIMLLSMFL